MLLLIADDDRDAVVMLAELLRLILPPPLEIKLAFDGKEALDAVTVATASPDVVIMDVEMPRMDGINAALGIRRALGSKVPKLIAVTGHAGLTKLAAATSAFDHVMLKPVEIDELLRLLSLSSGQPEAACAGSRSRTSRS
jgi:CheY-like chemotaxis protein